MDVEDIKMSRKFKTQTTKKYYGFNIVTKAFNTLMIWCSNSEIWYRLSASLSALRSWFFKIVIWLAFLCHLNIIPNGFRFQVYIEHTYALINMLSYSCGRLSNRFLLISMYTFSILHTQRLFEYVLCVTTLLVPMKLFYYYCYCFLGILCLFIDWARVV